MPIPLDLLSRLPLAQGGAAGAPPGSGLLPTLIMFAPIILLFYFLILRPQQQQEKQRRKMIEALKKNDRVLTSAGIYGTVVSIDTDQDRMVLKVAENTKMDVTRSSVVRVLESSTEKTAESK
jgi:preprotein translocase subunit YajC